MPESVLKTLGERRNPTGEYADRVKFSITPDSDTISSERWENTEELKRMSAGTKGVIRTGECTPYANVILVAARVF